MPIPKKFFQARSQSNLAHRSIVLTLCIVIVISGFLLFGILISNSQIRSQSKCKYSKPRSVSVVWDKTSASSLITNGQDHKKHKVMGFVGIQTGFASVNRRKSLRKTWMPSDYQGLQRYFYSTFEFDVFLFVCLLCVFDMLNSQCNRRSD